MSDFLQRLIARHHSTAPRVLPNANTYFSAGAELAASEPAPEVSGVPEAGSAVEAAAGGVAPATGGTFAQPAQPVPDRQPANLAPAIHRNEQVTSGTTSRDVIAGAQRASSRRRSTPPAPDANPAQTPGDRRSSSTTTAPVQQAATPVEPRAGRSGSSGSVTASHTPSAAGMPPILPGVQAGPPPVPADSAGPSMAESVISSHPELNDARAGNGTAQPGGAATPPANTTVISPGPARGRHTALPRVPSEVADLPAKPVAHLTPGQLPPSHPDIAPHPALRSRQDTRFAPAHVATVTGREPLMIHTAAHATDPEPHRQARQGGTHLPGGTPSDSQTPVATPASRSLAGPPIAPVVPPALPITPTQTAAPSVTISIGTIEVRAAPPAHTTVVPPAATLSGPRLSLDDYLRRRNGGGA